ncbi:MAG: hypothetical protein FWE41_07955 [Coriobacteriia bacterium]|nr:hypothetical protein [Coriobacteriia bacterium]MCL2750581.1 hypothetical protein [Coriobacteriia bacterium]
MNDLRVVDEQYNVFMDAIASYGKAAEEWLVEYLMILDDFCVSAISEGAAAKNFRHFTTLASGFKGQLQEIGEIIQASGAGYIEEIDAADEYIY